MPTRGTVQTVNCVVFQCVAVKQTGFSVKYPSPSHAYMRNSTNSELRYFSGCCSKTEGVLGQISESIACLHVQQIELELNNLRSILLRSTVTPAFPTVHPVNYKVFQCVAVCAAVHDIV